MDQEEIADHIRATPPDCIGAFDASPVEMVTRVPEYFTPAWHLRCECGCDAGRVTGYPLKDLNPTYDGTDLVSPLQFECERCGRATEILDTDKHGYHAEVGRLEGGVGSVKIRGTGDSTAHACPSCAQKSFSIDVGFVFWDFDIIDDEPDIEGQNFFNEFLMHCKCSGCGAVSEPTHLGKL